MSSNFTISYLYKLRDKMSGKIEQIRKTAKKMSKEIEKSGRRMSVSWEGVGKQAKRIGKTAMIAGASITAPLALMTREAMKFEKGVAELATLIPTKTLKGVKEEVGSMLLGISKKFGKGASDVTASAYQAVSAGIPPTKKALGEFLSVASKASVGGVTSLETAVDGITSTMNAFKAEGISATQISDKMFTAVRLGKTTFEEMSKSMFNVAPIASGLKIKFGEVTSAIASVTAKGVPTRVVTTQMKMMLTELSKSSSKVSKVFKVISGKSFPEFIKGGGTMQQALNMIRSKADEAGVELSDVFGSVEASSVAMNLTGKNAKSFSVALEQTKKSAGATAKAYNKMSKSASFKWDKAVAGLKATSITLGSKLLPILTKVANKFSGLMEWVSKFIDKNPTLSSAIIVTTGVLGVLLTGLGAIGFIGGSAISGIIAIKTGFLALAGSLGLTTTSFGAFTASVWASTVALLANPITWVVVAVVALGVAVWQLYKNWDTVISGLSSLWASWSKFVVNTVDIVVDYWVAVWQKVNAYFSKTVEWIKANWKGLAIGLLTIIAPPIGILTGLFYLIYKNWDTICSYVKTAWVSVWEWISSTASGIVSSITGFFGSIYTNFVGIVTRIKDSFSSLWGYIVGIFRNGLNTLTSFLPDFVKDKLGLNVDVGMVKEKGSGLANKSETIKRTVSTSKSQRQIPTRPNKDIPSGKKVDVNLKSDVGGTLKIEIDNKGKAKVKKVEQNGNLGFQVGG